MRVALLSMLETAEGGEDLRAGLTVSGRSIAHHQLGLALALGCTRIVFIAEKLEHELVRLQHLAEDAGAQFHVIAAPRALVPLVSPADELIVLADGVLAIPDDAIAALEQGPAVLALPIEAGLPAGFERIDINHSAAGAMRLPGRLVGRLGDLPGDWSAYSALLRIAGQASVPTRALPAMLLDQGRWRLVHGEVEAHSLENTWMRLLTVPVGSQSPGERLSTMLVRSAGPALLHAGTKPWVVMLASLLVAALGAGAGMFGYFASGFVLLGLAWLGRQSAALLQRIDRVAFSPPKARFDWGAAIDWLIDAGFVAVCAWRLMAAVEPDPPVVATAFTPLVLFGLLRLVPRVVRRPARSHWLDDRALAGIALALASILLPFDVFLPVIALVVLAVALGCTYLRPRTPNPALTVVE